VKAGKFTYFFDLNQSKSGEHLYLTINQSEYNGEDNPREYNRLTIFPKNIREFYEGLCDMIRALREEEKKRGPKQSPALTDSAASPEYDAFADEE